MNQKRMNLVPQQTTFAPGFEPRSQPSNRRGACRADDGAGRAGSAGRTSSGSGSAGGEGGEEVVEGVEAVGADYGGAVGPGGGHAADLGAVAGGLGAGVG